MISNYKELLLFDNKVFLEDDLEKWLPNLEIQMKYTILEKINTAAQNFETMIFDEWIFQYPQYVITTSLQAIITNEINLLVAAPQSTFFDENKARKDKELEMEMERLSKNMNFRMGTIDIFEQENIKSRKDSIFDTENKEE